MAAEGIAKRATIGVGFHTNQEAIDAFEHSLRTIGEDTGKLRDTFNRTNLVMDRFNEHIEQLTGHNNEAMDRLREADNKAAEASRHLGNSAAHTAAIHNHASQSIINNTKRMAENSRQATSSQINNMHHVADEAKSEQSHISNSLHNQTREQYQSVHAMGQYSREMMHGNETSGRFASANGRVARSFRYSGDAISQHERAIRNAQSRSYRWLRTAQDMSGATLGLGAAFYKGAKDATTLQQAYIHAGNMAHYGGEKMSRVQHDINQQWQVGSNLSVKYGISQNQIAKGYQALVARGYTTNESLHTQKSLLQAAIASGDNYNDVVKDSTNVLDAYNMRSRNAATMTDNTRKVVNEMAYAADQTATNFQGLGIGMSYVAATAHTTHQSISETSSALGILSNKGMQASQAGVGLRKVLNSFLSVNKKGQQAQVMQQLGLSEQDFKTSSGHLKSLGALMTLLNNKTKNMDSQERGAVFHRFFGAIGQEAALNLASDTKGLSQLNDQVERSQTMGKNRQGYVALLSAHNMKSAQNQFNKFKQAWQAFTITAAREILPEFTTALKHLDVYIAKLNDLSPTAKKWTIFGALAIASIAPIAGVVFGIKSAFHGLELTMLHIRHIFSKPVSSNMNKSIWKQYAEDKAGADITKGDSSNGTISRVAKYDKGGIGYKALSVLGSHPTTIGIGSAVSLGTTMGVLMGTNANYQAKKQVDRLRNRYSSNPIQERIKAELDQESVNKSLSGNRRFEKQLQRQTQATTNNISGLLHQETKQHEATSNHNIKILRNYAHISKSQARNLSIEDKHGYKVDYNNANNALKAISQDKDKHALDDDQKRINANKREISKLLVNGKHLNSSQLEANNRRINKLRQSDNKFYHDETATKENEWKRAYKAINNVIAGNGSKEKSIYERLSRANNHISTQTAARLLQNSYKTTHGQITNANNAYHKTSSFAWKRYNEIKHAAADEYGVNSKTYKAIVNKAAKSRNSEINMAKTKRTAIVSEATAEHQRIMKLSEQQHSGLDHEVDLTTGHFKTEWSETFNWLKNLVSGISSLFNHLTGGFTHKLSVAADNAGSFGKTRMATHAVGGAIPHNEMSLVNERGRESAYNPTTNRFRLFPDNGPQVIPLYQGEHVLTAQDTRELLTTGMGRGITLPGYANGTDKLNNLKPIHGYVNGRGEAIAQSAMHAGKGGENTFNGLKDAESDFNPYSWAYTIPHDLAGRGSTLHKATSVATDLPIDKLGHAAKGLRTLHISRHLVKPLTLSAHAIKRPLEGLRSLHRLTHPLSSSLDLVKNHVHGFAESLGHMIDPSKLNKNFKAIAPMLHKGIDIGMSKAKSAVHSGFNYLMNHSRRIRNGMRKLGHNIARNSGKLWRSGISKLRRFGRSASRFGHVLWTKSKHLGHHLWSGTKQIAGKVWSSTKHTASRMWSVTKHTAGKMWNSAKHTGKSIWSNTKRIASNISKSAHSLWNRTKTDASRTWSHVVSGAHRMASNISRTTSRLFHKAIAKGRNAWSDIKSGAASAVSRAKALINGLKSAASEAASWIKNKLSHIHMPHFANGGPIHKSTMALVGEHGPETAYNARTGIVRLLGTHGPQITELLAGERVLTNTQTQRLLHGGLGSGMKLPAFARGTGEEVIDNSSYHGTKSMSITGRFNGKDALSSMKHFSKKSKSIWDDLADYITKSTRDTHSNNNDEWQDMAKDLDKINDDLSKDTRDSFSTMSQKVTKLASDLHDGLVDSASDMAEGFGDKFKKLITYAKDDMISVIDKLNRGVEGIDHALRAFGGNSHVIHEIHYAKGTMGGHIAYNQLGILNDATSGPRQEAILRGNQMLFPQGHDVTVPLQKGDAVLNGDQTKQLINNTTNINHYAKGSGLHINFKHIGQLIKTIGLALKGPTAFFKKTFGHLVGNPVGHQLTKGLEETGMEAVKPLGIKWTRAMFSFIHSLVNPSGVSASASAFLNYAENHRPHNYVYGGAPGLNDTDCSGFVEACLRHFGISAPRTSGAQIAHFQHITRSEARPGDLLGTGAHIGIVADNGAHHYFSNHGPNGAHPAASMTPYEPSEFPGGAASFARVPQLAKYNKPKHKKATPFLQKLVASELGSPAIHWLKKIAPLIAGGGDSDYDTTHIGGLGGPWTHSGSQAYNIAKAVFFAAKSLGMDAKHAAALTGNAAHESARFAYGLNVHQFGGGPGVGLFQFNDPPSDRSPLGQDKAILANGLSAGDKSHWEHSSGSISGLTNSFERTFERGRIPDFGLRDEMAEKSYSLFAANGGWADKDHMRIFGEAGPEVAINPNRDTADHLIIQAIAARMRHSPESPIAGLVKSLGIRHKAHSLANDIRDLLTKPANPKPKQNNNSVKINVTNNITIKGNPGANQTRQITRNVEKAIQRGVQRAALQTRNRLDW